MIVRAISSAVAAYILLCVAQATMGMAATPKKTAAPLVVHDGTGKPTAKTGVVAKKADNGTPLLPGGGSKEPISINADALDFLNRENKLIYTGHVVAVQGDSTLKASKLNIDLEKNGTSGAPQAPADPAAGSRSVRHMEADGPVTLTSKDQIGTGDHATYDKAEDKVYLKGNVTLTQGSSIVQGDDLIYDMSSGQARVVGNVRTVLTPGTKTQGPIVKDQADRGATP